MNHTKAPTQEMREYCLRGYVELLKEIMPADPPPEMLDELLALAVSSESRSVIDYLIDEQSMAAKGLGAKALVVALQWRSKEMVGLLLEKGVDCRTRYGIALRIAAGIGEIELFRLLADSIRIDPLDDGYDALKEAAKGGHIEILDLLISLAEDREFARNMALMVACDHGSLEAVRFLHKGLGEAADGYAGRAMCVTASTGHLEILKFLMNNSGHAARKDSRVDNLLLTAAIRMGHLNILQYLSGKIPISAGWEVDDKEIDQEIKDYLKFWRRCENLGLPAEQVKPAYEADGIRASIENGQVQNAEEMRKLATSLAPRRSRITGKL